ncbi:MAG: cytochrome c biogenesis protein ResB, partial [Acidobacteriota bacterium]
MKKESEGSAGVLETASKFFSSLKLTVVLLLTLAATSIIGTVLPQNADPMAYRRAFGEILYGFFNHLGLFDMYHSWWFILLLLLLAINILICSINRLNALWKIIFTRNPKYSLNSFRNTKNTVQFNVSRAWQAMVPAIDRYLDGKFRSRVRQDSDSGCVFFAEKWRWSRIGVYIVHLGVILLLVGAVI